MKSLSLMVQKLKGRLNLTTHRQTNRQTEGRQDNNNMLPIIWSRGIKTKLFQYYTLQSSLQNLRSVMLDDGTSCAGDLRSGSVLSRGSIISKRPHVFECIHITWALKHNTLIIRFYRTSIVTKDLNNAYWVTLIVKLYSVSMNNRNTECE